MRAAIFTRLALLFFGAVVAGIGWQSYDDAHDTTQAQPIAITVEGQRCTATWWWDEGLIYWWPAVECRAPQPLSLPNMVRAAFPEEPEHAVSTVDCETGGTWDNSVVGALGELSIWQIHPIHFRRFDPARLRADPAYATWAARQLYDEAGGFGPWSCG